MSLASKISPQRHTIRVVAKSPLRGKRVRSSAPSKSAVGSGTKAHPTGRAIPACKKEIDLIVAYMASDLKIAVQAEFEAHLKACPDCAAFLATYKKTIEITRSFLQGHAPRKPTFQLALHR